MSKLTKDIVVNSFNIWVESHLVKYRNLLPQAHGTSSFFIFQSIFLFNFHKEGGLCGYILGFRRYHDYGF
jgi:hypothetical protein